MAAIKVINRSNNPLPDYASEHAAGMDVRAFLNAPITIKPFGRVLIPTGLYIELPVGFEAQIRPRSGLALKQGLTILNTPGTIDADYRGEVGIIVINLSDKDIIISNGDRICQMVISRFEKIQWKISETLLKSDRGEGGFGHTGHQ